MKFIDQTKDTKPDTVGIVDMKLTKYIGFNKIFLERHMIARKEREDKVGSTLSFLGRDNLKFQEILVDGLLKQYIMGNVTIVKLAKQC